MLTDERAHKVLTADRDFNNALRKELAATDANANKRKGLN